MESIARMIDTAQKVCGGTRTGVADRLGVDLRRLNEWARGARPMPAPKVAALALAAGADPVKALGEVAAERLRKRAVRAAGALLAFLLTAGGADGISDAHAARQVGDAQQAFSAIVAAVRSTAWRVLRTALFALRGLSPPRPAFR